MFNIRSEIWRQSVTVSVFCFHFFNAFLRSCDLSLTVPILLRRLILFFLMLPFDPLKTLIQSEIVSGAPKGNAGRERVKPSPFLSIFRSVTLSRRSLYKVFEVLESDVETFDLSFFCSRDTF